MRPTRGGGKLEGVLARWRMRAALGVVDPSLRGGDVLDIGCGSYPFFLVHSPFRRKVGLEQRPMGPQPGIEMVCCLLARGVALPFPDQSFDCVTSLALLEHLDPAALPDLLREAHRVLRPSGQFVATTPHAAADSMLRALAALKLVSGEEIKEHQSRFHRGQIRRLLAEAGFAPARISVSGFQLGLNILVTAYK